MCVCVFPQRPLVVLFIIVLPHLYTVFTPLSLASKPAEVSPHTAQGSHITTNLLQPKMKDNKLLHAP